MTLCLSGHEPVLSKLPGTCSKASVRRTVGGYAIDASCQSRRGTFSIHGTASGDFQTSYKADLDMTVQMPGRAPMITHVHSAYAWAGACAPGETPDDQ